ncbi:amidohydrolase [Blastococcus sp. SYSU D00820]
MSAPDLVLVDGEVLTVDRDFTVAEAVAVSGGRIVATGTTAEVLALAGKATRVVELGGRTVLPGINDSHLHGCAYGASLPPLEFDVSSDVARSLADVRAAIAAEVAAKGPGVPLVGNGWDLGYLAETRTGERLPTRWDIDEVSPDNPVYLQDFSRHLAWVNTRWLELAGVPEDATAPPGGVVYRQPERGLTGLFAEGAQALVQKVLPQLDEQRRRAAITATVARLNALGITSYTEPGLGTGGGDLMGGAMGARTLETYLDLARSGGLGARVSVLWLPSDMSGSAAEVARSLRDIDLPGDVDPRRVRLVGGKLFADGIPPNKTAFMHEPYADGGHGSLCVHGDNDHERAVELAEMIRLLHVAGLQVGVHVTGDAGIDAVLDGFEAAERAHPGAASRHYLIHGDFTGPEARRRLAAGGWGLNMNPGIKATISDLMDEMLGEERSAAQWPVRSAVAAGIHVASSSDAPVTAPDWRVGVAGMLLRESKATGRVSGAAERVDLATAVRAYTIEPAWQDLAEDWKGSLERGKVADLCVLGGSLLTADPHDIPQLPVDMTVLDGDVVFERA